MAKLPWNKFYNTHHQRICVSLQFTDYKKGSKLVSGKTIPTPNQVVAALTKELRLEGDYTLKSFNDGKVQVVMISNQNDVQKIVNQVQCGPQKVGDGQPCSVTMVGIVEMQKHISIATQLGLF